MLLKATACASNCQELKELNALAKAQLQKLARKSVVFPARVSEERGRWTWLGRCHRCAGIVARVNPETTPSFPILNSASNQSLTYSSTAASNGKGFEQLSAQLQHASSAACCNNMAMAMSEVAYLLRQRTWLQLETLCEATNVGKAADHSRGIQSDETARQRLAAATYMEMSKSAALEDKKQQLLPELFAVLASGLPHNCEFVRRCLFFPSFKKSKGCMLLEVPPQSSQLSTCGPPLRPFSAPRFEDLRPLWQE